MCVHAHGDQGQLQVFLCCLQLYVLRLYLPLNLKMFKLARLMGSDPLQALSTSAFTLALELQALTTMPNFSMDDGDPNSDPVFVQQTSYFLSHILSPKILPVIQCRFKLTISNWLACSTAPKWITFELDTMMIVIIRVCVTFCQGWESPHYHHTLHSIIIQDRSD